MNEDEKALIKQLPHYGWHGLWLVEWNEDQEAFHVESAYSRFGDSIAAFNQKHNRGAWVSLGIFNSYIEAEDFVDQLRARRGL